MTQVEPVHYLPLATTLIAGAFLVTLGQRAVARRWAPHLVWWAVGVLFYGAGTAIESIITLSGNTPTLNSLWYVAGAILGGYPLGVGSAYLLLPRRWAHVALGLSLPLVIFAGVVVLLSPVDAPALAETGAHRPSGAYLEWTWVRLLTPFINLFAAVFLVGGALWSCARFLIAGTNPWRAAGTALIAVGGILPGVGGAMAKAGNTEALYVGEFLGLILIWLGYAACLRGPTPGRPAPTTDLPTQRPG